MNKTLKVATTQKEVVEHVKDIYGKEVIVTIDKDSLEPTIKNKGKGAISKEIKQFILDFVAEELAPFKAVGTGLEVGYNVVEKGVEADNSIATAIGQAIKEVVEVTMPSNKTWDDITLAEVNRGHMLEFKDTPIPIMQIDGKGMEHCKVSFVGMKSKIQYYWNCYGDVLYMTLSDVMEMFDLKKDKYKSVIKPLDDKVQKIYNLTEYYNLIDEATNVDMVELFDKPIEVIRKFVTNIKNTLENDVFLNLRTRINLYLITAKGRYTIDELNEILEIFDLTPYDIHLESVETRKFI